MSGARHRLTGRLTVALPPDEAFHLFTAQGERRWVPHWEPSFPAPAADDTEPGTVFQTLDRDQTTTWIVVEATPGRRILYARVTPGVSAGTVSVVLDEAGDQSNVTVTYELTALSSGGAAHLRRFADGYPAFLAGWQDAIAETLHDDAQGPTT
ncbi:SRPBCC family protein [Actinomadura mexicana]|uniref:Polyketide cyclase / dehydrase and lipid transport n=1 Tax=Actinomadura mexicana TaxID=134959 RepID=A0A238V1C4_9ACTN|nr:SRPBCC family protein [Actinomadura mexicana]SNR28362.1 Polyketide cyclase / dehydrase and lipid transport [Actinomadura mexicana]